MLASHIRMLVQVSAAQIRIEFSDHMPEETEDDPITQTTVTAWETQMEF